MYARHKHIQAFVADVKGSDYSKGFYVDNQADKLFVGESVIDIMSKMTLLKKMEWIITIITIWQWLEHKSRKRLRMFWIITGRLKKSFGYG